MSEKILFIINPHSGTSKTPLSDEAIAPHIHHNDWSCQVTEYPGHAREIAKQHKSSVQTIVAVGGDGTVNEVASSLLGTGVALGIIPRGSGNGLSNALGIPKHLKKAISVIQRGNTMEIDSMLLNEHCFVNMAGIGFDAHIAHLFDSYGPRGLLSYSQLILKEFSSFSEFEVDLKFNGSAITEKAFVMSFANSSQYGNNAHIAPTAVMDDGKAEICVVQKFPLLAAPRLAQRLFRKTIHQSTYYHAYQASEIEINCEKEMQAHVDGEPINIGKEARIKVNHKNLKVIIP